MARTSAYPVPNTRQANTSSHFRSGHSGGKMPKKPTKTKRAGKRV